VDGAAGFSDGLDGRAEREEGKGQWTSSW
jgi:hypothetical protein